MYVRISTNDFDSQTTKQEKHLTKLNQARKKPYKTQLTVGQMHVVCQHGRMHRRRRCRFVVPAGRRCSPITITRSCRTIIAASFGWSSLVAHNHEQLAIQVTDLVTSTWIRSPPAECLRRLSISRSRAGSFSKAQGNATTQGRHCCRSCVRCDVSMSVLRLSSGRCLSFASQAQTA